MCLNHKDTKYRTMDLYFAVAIIVFAVTVESCPPQCRSCTGGTADCVGVGLRDIPRNFPSETVTIDLTDNQLTDMQQSDFPVQSNVQNLRLSKNGLSAIAPRVFSNNMTGYQFLLRAYFIYLLIMQRVFLYCCIV